MEGSGQAASAGARTESASIDRPRGICPRPAGDVLPPGRRLDVVCRLLGADRRRSRHPRSSLTRAPSACTEAPVERPCVCVRHADLVAGVHAQTPALQAAVAQAYGYGGLGVLAVTDVPQLTEHRQKMLPLGAKFAALPDATKRKTETPHAFFQVGWSYGNEKLQGDQPDWAKGSYYANPLVDVPSDDANLIARFPSFLEPNVWPTEDLPEFEGAFKALGRAVVDVGRMVAKQCDDYTASQCPSYEGGKLFKLLQRSKCCKGRFLHYYPADQVQHLVGGQGNTAPDAVAAADMAFSDWCGWHNDHGSLTGLVPAMFMNARGEEVPNPDPSAGLYIRSTTGTLVKVLLPPGSSSLAFQIGETAQIHTGGVLQATPHAVRGPSGQTAAGISRETMAVFMEPEYSGEMTLPAGRTVEDVQSGEAVKFLPSSIRTLASRWKPGMNFGEFSDATFNTFY